MHVVVSGREMEVPVELRAELVAIVNDDSLVCQKHAEICLLLGIGRFKPAPLYKPYTLCASFIQIRDGSKLLATFGGWHECFNCHFPFDHHPQGQTCPQCSKKEMPNFNLSSSFKFINCSDTPEAG
jgi:hypothetical protein